MKLKIAVPSKGRISNPSIDILEKAGLGLKDNNNRQLISKTNNKNIDIMFARASDIPEFVSDGIVDMGISGVDLIKESESDVVELLDLNFGQTKLVLASPEESEINSVEDLTSDMTIATEFPTLTKKYLKSHGLNSKIVKLSGSTEIAPFIGVADLITDLTSTGTTLKMNHLKIIDTILESTIVLITNDEALKNKKEMVEAVKRSIKPEQGRELANELNINYFETSALSGYNIKEAFETLTIDIMKKKKIGSGNNDNIDLKKNKKKKDSDCC